MSSSHPMPGFDTPAVATDLFGPVASIVVSTVRTVAFWIAVALPFLYVPLLLGGGTGANVLLSVAALVVVNVVALVVGHGHRRDDVVQS